jgi:hypothetical protein
VPIANAIFFCGDRVERTGNPVIEKLSDLQKLSEIVVSKFGSSINAWVIEASVFNGHFAVYKYLIPSVNQYGEPGSYNPIGFSASTSTVSLLSNCLEEVRTVSSPSIIRSENLYTKFWYDYKISPIVPEVMTQNLYRISSFARETMHVVAPILIVPILPTLSRMEVTSIPSTSTTSIARIRYKSRGLRVVWMSSLGKKS